MEKVIIEMLDNVDAKIRERIEALGEHREHTFGTEGAERLKLLEARRQVQEAISILLD